MLSTVRFKQQDAFRVPLMTGDLKQSALVNPLKLYTLDEVSELTNYSLSHLHRAIRARLLAHNRLGRCIRVSHADLEAFLKASRQSSRLEKK